MGEQPKPQAPMHRTGETIVSGVGGASIVPAPSNSKEDIAPASATPVKK